MTRLETKNLTSYDLVKCAALILMIIDHAGHFFYPDDMWLRALGRLSAPIWLFLIGYAKSRDLPWQMWAGTIFLMGINYMAGKDVLPVYIIGSMLLFRMIIDPVMRFIRHDPKSLYPFTAVLFVLTILTAPLFEYGSEGFILVMAGYLCRHRTEMDYGWNRLIPFLLVAGLSHFLAVLFFYFNGDFSGVQKIFVGLGLVSVMLALSFFRSAEYPQLSDKLPAPLKLLIQFCGRRTLEIYVLHLAAFHLIALAGDDPRYKLPVFISQLVS